MSITCLQLIKTSDWDIVTGGANFLSRGWRKVHKHRIPWTFESLERVVNAHYCLVEKAFRHGMPWIRYCIYICVLTKSEQSQARFILGYFHPQGG
jgi:hypothetical protein